LPPIAIGEGATVEGGKTLWFANVLHEAPEVAVSVNLDGGSVASRQEIALQGKPAVIRSTTVKLP